MIISFVSTALLFAATVPRPVSSTSLPDWTHWVQNGGRYENLHSAYCHAFHREVEEDGETIGPMLGEVVGSMRFESPAAKAGDIVGKARYDLPMGDLNSNICNKDFARAMMNNCWTAGVRLGLTQEPHVGELQAIRPPEGVQYCSMKFWFRLFKDSKSSLGADYVPQCLKISMNCALMGLQFPMHRCVRGPPGTLNPSAGPIVGSVDCLFILNGPDAGSSIVVSWPSVSDLINRIGIRAYCGRRAALHPIMVLLESLSEKPSQDLEALWLHVPQLE